MGRLDDKVAVITGSTRGFGRATARRFLDAGARVVVSGRSADVAARVARELDSTGQRVIGIGCDVTDLASMRALAAGAIERFGRFDVWVNNAGLSAPYGPSSEIPPEQFARVLVTNVVGTYYGCHVALQHFVPARRGKLVNILGRGDSGVVPFQLAYSSSKWWAKAFTIALAKEHRESGVGIHAYNPGLMTTEMLEHVEAVEGWEAKLSPLKTVVRMWGKPPSVPAEQLLELVTSRTDGRTGIVRKQLGTAPMLSGALREGVRRVLGRTGPEVPMSVTPVRSTLRR